jgi:hypothetical protein
LASPALLRFEQEAIEAAGNRFRDWLHWLPTYGEFRHQVHAAADATGSDDNTVLRIVLARLTAAYDSHRRL